MSRETLEQSFRFLLKNPGCLVDPFVIAWHGGEPLTLPIDFYESAFNLLEEMAPESPRIENWFQTNATLINQDWCDLIKRWQIKIGVSVDGPEWIHDRYRVDRSGRGTFRNVLRGIELLKSNGIDFATVGVLSEYSLGFPDEIWRFYRSLGVGSLAFNFEDVEGVHVASSLRGQAGVPKAQAFFNRLLFLRNSEAPEVFIRELDYFLDGLPEWRNEFRRIENVPLGIIGIAWNGDVSTFSPELIGMKHLSYGDFVFGNVRGGTLHAMQRNLKFQVVRDQIVSGIQKCKATCQYFCVCGGGQPSNKLYQNGTFDSAETLACQLRVQSIANVAIDFLETRWGVPRDPAQSIRQRVQALQSLMEAKADPPHDVLAG
jgi:uncharacterized protein